MILSALGLVTSAVGVQAPPFQLLGEVSQVAVTVGETNGDWSGVVAESGTNALITCFNPTGQSLERYVVDLGTGARLPMLRCAAASLGSHVQLLSVSQAFERKAIPIGKDKPGESLADYTTHMSAAWPVAATDSSHWVVVWAPTFDQALPSGSWWSAESLSNKRLFALVDTGSANAPRSIWDRHAPYNALTAISGGGIRTNSRWLPESETLETVDVCRTRQGFDCWRTVVDFRRGSVKHHLVSSIPTRSIPRGARFESVSLEGNVAVLSGHRVDGSDETLVWAHGRLRIVSPPGVAVVWRSRVIALRGDATPAVFLYKDGKWVKIAEGWKWQAMNPDGSKVLAINQINNKPYLFAFK